MDVKSWSQGLKGKLCHPGQGLVAPKQIQQKRGNQRAMHHQARVALHPGHIAAVVMNAVAVECQRRVTKQQHRVGLDQALKLFVSGRNYRRGHRCIGLGRVAVHNVMFLAHGQALRASVFMANANKHQGAAAAALDRHILDGGDLGGGFAHAQWLVKLQPPAGPHAPGQRHRRQEAATLGMAIGPDIACQSLWSEVDPVP